MKKRICEIFAIIVIMFSLYHFAEEWKETNRAMQKTDKIPDTDSAVQLSDAMDKSYTKESGDALDESECGNEVIESEETQSTESIIKQNEEKFYEAADKLGLNKSEAADYYARLCEDNVFRDGTRLFSSLQIYDLDGNGQKDMAVMVQEGELYLYGEGYIYFYMNEDQAYCFEDKGYPFFSVLNIAGGDFDCDGNIEIAFESRGTGNGGSGDWHSRILKYRNHSMEKMEFPSETYEDDIRGIYIEITQEALENTYSAYCPYFDETIVFEADNIFEPNGQRVVGSSSRGYFDLRTTEYEGRDALVVSEYLFAEGGHAHCVGLAKFLIVWDKDGSGCVKKWWIESSGGSKKVSMESIESKESNSLNENIMEELWKKCDLAWDEMPMPEYFINGNQSHYNYTTIGDVAAIVSDYAHESGMENEQWELKQIYHYRDGIFRAYTESDMGSELYILFTENTSDAKPCYIIAADIRKPGNENMVFQNGECSYNSMLEWYSYAKWFDGEVKMKEQIEVDVNGDLYDSIYGNSSNYAIYDYLDRFGGDKKIPWEVDENTSYVGRNGVITSMFCVVGTEKINLFIDVSNKRYAVLK